MKALFVCVLIASAASLALADGNVSGKWQGSFNTIDENGDIKESTALFVFKQAGGEITGTVGPTEEEQFPIQKGRIEGDKITLEADNNGQILKFNLVLSGDKIIGEAQMSREGQTRRAKIEVTRTK
jgi:hypothetical protein